MIGTGSSSASELLHSIHFVRSSVLAIPYQQLVPLEPWINHRKFRTADTYPIS
jgi:hypothetical protein